MNQGRNFQKMVKKKSNICLLSKFISLIYNRSHIIPVKVLGLSNIVTVIRTKREKEFLENNQGHNLKQMANLFLGAVRLSYKKKYRLISDLSRSVQSYFVHDLFGKGNQLRALCTLVPTGSHATISFVLLQRNEATTGTEEGVKHHISFGLKEIKRENLLWQPSCRRVWR